MKRTIAWLQGKWLTASLGAMLGLAAPSAFAYGHYSMGHSIGNAVVHGIVYAIIFRIFRHMTLPEMLIVGVLVLAGMWFFSRKK